MKVLNIIVCFGCLTKKPTIIFKQIQHWVSKQLVISKKCLNYLRVELILKENWAMKIVAANFIPWNLTNYQEINE